MIRIKKKVENIKPLKVKSQGEDKDLSAAQKDVLFLLTQEFLTVKQVAIRRKTTVQAIYKIIRKLKKKGSLGMNNRGFKGVENIKPTFKPPKHFKPHKIRLHGQEFNIKILFKDHRYKDLLKKCNLLHIDGNTIRLFKDAIEVYSGQSFYADTVQKATVRSFNYWNRLFIRLENEFNVIILKPKYQNIKLVNQHYAEVNNELAEESEKKGDKIRVYTTDDGKLWFTIDNSFNLHEAETVHPSTAQHDIATVVSFFNDLRDNTPPTLSQLMGIINKMAEINKDTAAGLNAFIKSQLPNKEDVMPEGQADYFG